MNFGLELDYTLQAGWCAPWIEGLRTGAAMALRCDACAAAYFPPLPRCPTCDTPCESWHRLDGTAIILFRTAGADGDFVLARLDGATGAAVMQAKTLPPGATRGALLATPDGPPFLCLGPEGEAHP